MAISNLQPASYCKEDHYISERSFSWYWWRKYMTVVEHNNRKLAYRRSGPQWWPCISHSARWRWSHNVWRTLYRCVADTCWCLNKTQHKNLLTEFGHVSIYNEHKTVFCRVSTNRYYLYVRYKNTSYTLYYHSYSIVVITGFTARTTTQ